MVIISKRQNSTSYGLLNTLRQMRDLTYLLPEENRDHENLMGIECLIKELEEEIGNRLYKFRSEPKT